MTKALTIGAPDRAIDAGEGLVARLRAAFAQYRLYRRTLEELSHLSDRELADLGISRFDIQRIARESVRSA